MSSATMSPNRGCFCIPCFHHKTTPFSFDRILSPSSKTEARWWARGYKKVLELKTFLRRFFDKQKRTVSFNYDPLSYALNFDDGFNGDDGEDGYGGFSARFASVSRHGKEKDDNGGHVRGTFDSFGSTVNERAEAEGANF
ncbi:hypothetical protein RIF29_18785 [Crotalaria pallida]|uniref:Uncharacterized protein n=1 Tax=Crotalaria pallida TaxID=3830 RepID=A0AAN9F2S5_CROPI